MFHTTQEKSHLLQCSTPHHTYYNVPHHTTPITMFHTTPHLLQCSTPHHTYYQCSTPITGNQCESNEFSVVDTFQLVNYDITSDTNSPTGKIDLTKTSEVDETSNFKWEKYSNGCARRNINKMGYNGKGLGKKENGIRDPIEIKTKRSLNEEVKATNCHTKTKKTTVCVLSDSMLNQINGEKLSKTKEVTVMSCGGCTVKCMYTHLPKVFIMNPKHIVLHIGTNDCTKKTSDQVLEELTNLKC